MTQKKGKAEKKSTKEASLDGSALILDYLRKQNRPYSAIDISTNLHNKVTKCKFFFSICSLGIDIRESTAYTIKALRELHQKKEIECRVAGKQMIYHAVQEDLDETGPGAVAAMDDEIESLQEELPGLKENDKKMQAELNSLNAIPLLTELRIDIDKLEEEKVSLVAHLAKVHGDGSTPVSPQEKENVRKDWKTWQNQARVRGQICRDLWRKCSEALPENTTPEELWEGLGLEGTPM